VKSALPGSPPRTPWFLLVLALSLSACIYLPREVQRQADSAHATAASGLGPYTIVRTLSYQRGPRESSKDGRVATQCTSEHASMRLLWRTGEMTTEEGIRLCGQITAGIEYVAAFAAETPHLSYEIELLPFGRGFLHRSLSVQPRRSPVRFWFGWNAKQDSSAEVVNTLAHETLHIIAAAIRLPREQRKREREAYLAGACAQLATLGDLPRDSLINPALDAGTPRGALDSSLAGAQVAESLRAAYPEPLIRADSDQGSLFLQQCSEELESFLSRTVRP
jgi:hypothetical protein